jgi:hypothetical protein
MEGACADLDVEGLLEQTAFAAPEFTEFDEQVLKVHRLKRLFVPKESFCFF